MAVIGASALVILVGLAAVLVGRPQRGILLLVALARQRIGAFGFRDLGYEFDRSALGLVLTPVGFGALVAAMVATCGQIFPVDLYLWITLGALTSIELPESSVADSPCDPVAVASRPTFAGS